MPPKLEKETLVLLINIGVTRPNAQKNRVLLDKIKCVAQRIIEKKIFLRPKDEIGVVLMGSSVTKNSLNTDHVGEFADFQIPDWNLIQKIMHLNETNYCSNWIEALSATVEFIKKNAIDNSMRKVILMSDFNEEHDIILQFEVDTIAEHLHTEEIKLLTIAEELLDEEPESSLSISKAFLKDLHKKIDGQHVTFDNAVADLRFYLEVPTKPSPWYATLELIDIKIPIVSYIKVTDTCKFPSWKTAKGDENVVTVTEYSDRQRTIYKKDEIVPGYKYGGVFIPVEKKLEDALSYKSGPKSYIIHSFARKRDVDLEHWYDNTTNVVLPSSRVQNAQDPFYSLVLAMLELDVVAIVRKVNNNDRAPKMVALFPCIDVPDEPWCLVEISLAFAEDRRVMVTRPIKSVIKQLTSEQNEAVDNLLDSLILPETEDSYIVEGNQCFLPGSLPDPAMQHIWNMLSHRALNPDKPLPPMEDYLKKILEAPSVKEKSKDHLQRVAELFQLESIDPKAKKKNEFNTEDNEQDVNKINLEESTKMDDKLDTVDSFKELDMSTDTVDIDLDELAANI
ncbi:X-ray repair cross-complementing protein 5-like [Colletes gigas]|uniref:X-ray repair cross-complementing protein 5-like n=1 Tax=Colletes gigas TaxID=935657 RepID=UPI001C9B5F06|nr:X-ray repair cross-complementing protein 5-like [Colletes gigas]